MKKYFCEFLAVVTIFASGIIPPGADWEVFAGVNVEVNIGPPVIMYDEPDEIVYAPGYGVYFVPGLAYDIFFFNGFWWSRRGSYWYRSRYYRSGWGRIRGQDVPRAVFRVPTDYRTKFARQPHIRYKSWKGRPGRAKNVSSRAVKTQAGSVNPDRGGENRTGAGINNPGRCGEQAPQNGGEGGGQNMGRGGGREEGHGGEGRGEEEHR